MRLLVVPFLQAILHSTQEAIRPGEFLDGRVGKQLLADQQFQRRQQLARLQPRIAAAADQLEGLHDELDFPDAARPEFHVVLEVAPLHFASDHLFHAAQGLEHAEVEIAAVHERTQHVAVQVRLERLPRDDTGLHIGVALPIAAVLLQIGLERIETRRQRTAFTERSQAHVNAIDEAVRSGVRKQMDRPLPDLDEVFGVADGPRPVGLPALRIEEHEIDIGGEIQLAAAELAHAEDHERLESA